MALFRLEMKVSGHDDFGVAVVVIHFIWNERI
jgi:hypothetical protein